MFFHQLINTLDQLKLTYSILDTKKDGKLVVLQRGARVLGIFPNDTCKNLLWTSTYLLDLEKAQSEFINSTSWNIGGDRTWLSPEIEYNIRDLDNLWDTYAIQPILDPGNYQFDYVEEYSVSMTQSTCPRAYRSKLDVPIIINKIYRLIPDPLHILLSDHQTSEYTYVGYNMKTFIQFENKSIIAPLSVWQLTQLPAGGKIIIPTYGTANVDHFFGAPDSPRIFVDSHSVHLNIDARESFKISIKVPYLTGRIGYYHEVNEDQASLMIRQFDTRPAAEYGDVFVPNLDDPGHCVQCYNDDGTLGDFGEMEYHTPLIKSSLNELCLEDYNETYCYIGSKKIIGEIRRLLLGL